MPPKKAPRPRRSLKPVMIGVLIIVLAAASGWWWMNRPGEPQPNVFVFLLDTVRQDALGCYGHPAGPTPNMDAVAADGVRFDQAVSTSGWTLPAVASLMTGTWPTLHGALGKGVVLTPIREEFPTAAEVLRSAGLETIGIANAAFVSPMVGLDRGFDVFDHRYSYNWDARRADETIDVALDELRQRRSKSGFYFIHLFDAHLDYDPPRELAAKYTAGRLEPTPPLNLDAVLGMQGGEDGKAPPSTDDVGYVRGLYDAEVNFIDIHVGRFIDKLKSLALYDKATIIITSDHGEEFWDHGGFEHGHTLYDELVRIPLIIKLPAAIEPASRVVEAQVRLLDVMPTVFEILSVNQPETFLGESLMSIIAGASDTKLSALCESILYGAPSIALRGPQYKYIMTLADDGTGKDKLYDWHEDPLELNDLSDEMPQVSAELRAELLELQGANLSQARAMSQPERVNLAPDRIQQLRSLGYIR